MSFFKELSERMGDYTISLTIQKDKGQMVVMFVPKLETKKEENLKDLIPLTVKGTPDQLDAGFMLSLGQGIQMTTGLQTNIKEFESAVKKADKKVKGKDDKKPETKVDAPETTDDDDDDKTDDDEMPFGENATVNEATGEVKEEKPAEEKKVTKSAEPKSKSAEPKTKKEPEPKAEKVDPSANTGTITKTDDDEW
jgi:PRTRC genetic system protein E